MTLENLLKIGQLKEHPADAREIQRLAALVAMMAHGYRPDTKNPGHHQTLVQGLALTIGLPAGRVTLLDALRRKRNLSDYTGAGVGSPTAEPP